MEAVRAIYCRRPSLSSLFLRTAMWSAWSHVASIIPHKGTDYVIDSRFYAGGVKLRPLRELLAEESTWAVRSWDVPDAAHGYAWLLDQVGKPYDWKGVVGIGLHRDWQEEGGWFCSELHEAFLEQCGLSRFVNNPRRVTPQLSWMVR